MRRTESRSDELLQAFRAAIRVASPAVAFKAEAIVGPRDLVPYLGTGKYERHECDLAYHNVLMVLLWSALASGRVTLLTSALEAMPAVPPGAGWVTYVRCHDDIGWALAGLESAEDELAVELAIRRILLLDAVAFAHGGLPLIYMGDELGLLNDPAGRDDADNRWMRRPLMDWEAAERRHDPVTVQGRLWAGMKRLISARRSTQAIHAEGHSVPRWTGNDHVFALAREDAGDHLLVVANFTAEPHSRIEGDPQCVSLRGSESKGLLGNCEVA